MPLNTHVPAPAAAGPDPAPGGVPGPGPAAGPAAAPEVMSWTPPPPPASRHAGRRDLLQRAPEVTLFLRRFLPSRHAVEGVRGHVQGHTQHAPRVLGQQPDQAPGAWGPGPAGEAARKVGTPCPLPPPASFDCSAALHCSPVTAQPLVLATYLPRCTALSRVHRPAPGGPQPTTS